MENLLYVGAVIVVAILVAIAAHYLLEACLSPLRSKKSSKLNQVLSHELDPYNMVPLLKECEVGPEQLRELVKLCTECANSDCCDDVYDYVAPFISLSCSGFPNLSNSFAKATSNADFSINEVCSKCEHLSTLVQEDISDRAKVARVFFFMYHYYVSDSKLAKLVDVTYLT